MQPRLQSVDRSSLWSRTIALLCLLLSLQLVVVQSWHTHAAPSAASWKSGGAVLSAQTDGADITDAACPACAAMHFAPLGVTVLQQTPTAYFVVPVRLLAQQRRDSRLAFDLYGRPPPRF